MGGVGEVVEGRGTGGKAPMLFLSQAEDLRAKKNYFRTATAQNPYYYQGNKKFPRLFLRLAFSAEVKNNQKGSRF